MNTDKTYQLSVNDKTDSEQRIHAPGKWSSRGDDAITLQSSDQAASGQFTRLGRDWIFLNVGDYPEAALTRLEASDISPSIFVLHGDEKKQAIQGVSSQFTLYIDIMPDDSLVLDDSDVEMEGLEAGLKRYVAQGIDSAIVRAGEDSSHKRLNQVYHAARHAKLKVLQIALVARSDVP